MPRRGLLIALFATLAAPAAARPRRRGRRPLGFAAPPPAAPTEAKLRAPMPDRSIEAPRGATAAEQSFGPTVLQRTLPGRSPSEGPAPTLLEDQLFKPGLGARLRVPFSF